jgi:hypothetical protein
VNLHNAVVEVKEAGAVFTGLAIDAGAGLGPGLNGDQNPHGVAFVPSNIKAGGPLRCRGCVGVRFRQSGHV